MSEAPGARDVLELDPHWCLFWGDGVTGFHLDIWLPYLRRSHYRFAVMAGADRFSPGVREKLAALPNCAIIESFEAAPAILRRCPSFAGFLHVGSKTENFRVVNRFGGRLHVFLGHGESDKLNSASRTASIYDSVFVSRYRAVDRFPPAIRRWVRGGAIAIGSPIAEGATKDPWIRPRPVRTILYAPTWEGHGDPGDYSSLPVMGTILVDALPALAARGVTVIMRPHPTTGVRRPELAEIRDAIFAAGAVRGGAKADDFAAADVIVSDISGVLAEYLFTEKPAIMPITKALASRGKDDAHLAAEYPWVYRWDVEKEGLLDWLDRLASNDPLRSARASAARQMFRGHRSLDEAAATFDMALSVVRWRRTRIPPRYVFEARRWGARLLPRRRRRRQGPGARTAR